MTPNKNVNSTDSALILRNAIWAFPYLALMGLIWGYLAYATAGAILGLVSATAASVVIGSRTSIFTDTPDGSAVNTPRGPARTTIKNRKRPAGDLNGVRYLKLSNRFEDALIKIDEVLAKDPDFAEALFLKAQILWEGFDDREAAKECLLLILKSEPDKKTVFHRWAQNLYKDISAEI